VARELSVLRRADEPRYGGKSTGLGELLAAGIRVPPGFALSCGAYELFVAEAGLERMIAGTLRRVEPGARFQQQRQVPREGRDFGRTRATEPAIAAGGRAGTPVFDGLDRQ